jgi:hypothetical protein
VRQNLRIVLRGTFQIFPGSLLEARHGGIPQPDFAVPGLHAAERNQLALPACGGEGARQRARLADGMVGVRRVLDVTHRPFRHVTARAVRAAAAFGGLVALETLGPIESNLFGFRRCAMRIVARAAPQPVAADPLARALGKRLEMARHVHVRLAGPFKNHQRVREAVAWVKAAVRPCASDARATCTSDARFAGEMALGTDAVAAVRRKFRGIDRLPAPDDMRVARSVAALAGNTALPERR